MQVTVTAVVAPYADAADSGQDFKGSLPKVFLDGKVCFLVEGDMLLLSHLHRLHSRP